MSDSNVATVQSYFDNINGAGGDPFANFSDDLRYIIPGNGRMAGTYAGKDNMLKMFMEFGDKFDKLSLRPLELIASGDTVVVLAKGDCMTKEKRPYNNDYVFVFRFSNGKIIEVVEYLDHLLVESAIFGARLVG